MISVGRLIFALVLNAGHYSKLYIFHYMSITLCLLLAKKELAVVVLLTID